VSLSSTNSIPFHKKNPGSHHKKIFNPISSKYSKLNSVYPDLNILSLINFGQNFRSKSR